jgi:hypothetical protein
VGRGFKGGRRLKRTGCRIAFSNGTMGHGFKGGRRLSRTGPSSL